MSFRYSRQCGTASDAVDAVKWEIPQGFKLLKFKIAEYLKNIFKLTISKILNAQLRIKFNNMICQVSYTYDPFPPWLVSVVYLNLHILISAKKRYKSNQFEIHNHMSVQMYGWCGKIVRIHLTDPSWRVEVPDLNVLQTFIGGRGPANKRSGISGWFQSRVIFFLI